MILDLDLNEDSTTSQDAQVVDVVSTNWEWLWPLLCRDDVDGC